LLSLYKHYSLYLILLAFHYKLPLADKRNSLQQHAVMYIVWKLKVCDVVCVVNRQTQWQVLSSN